MKAKNKPGFRINNEPEVVFAASYLKHSFVGVSLIRAKVEGRHKLKSDVLKERSKASTPVGNGGVRY